jgi:prepilin-type N-terminal cleavage/methylation domain-containing protein/prepilin-type processing-associated H-X9-DG protein
MDVIPSRNKIIPMSRSSSKSAPKASGFTLIELLVVIAVIAILAGLLFPALGRAQKQAKTAACVSNLRECGVLIHLYANEHENSFPPVNNPGNAGYVVPLSAYLPVSAAKSGKNVFVSPAALYPCSNSATNNFTYAVHNGLFGGAGQDSKRVTDVTRPSEVIMMANGAQIKSYNYHCAFTFWNPNELNQGKGSNAATYLDKPIPADDWTNVDDWSGQGYLRYVQRDNKAINALMVDGHVVTIDKGKVLVRHVDYDQ